MKQIEVSFWQKYVFPFKLINYTKLKGNYNHTYTQESKHGTIQHGALLFIVFNRKLSFGIIEISSLAVQVTRERFRRCPSESFASDGRTEPHPATNSSKQRTNVRRELIKVIKFQIAFIIRICSYRHLRYDSKSEFRGQNWN